jgi:DNA-binding beta-propeller fold protein YncE
MFLARGGGSLRRLRKKGTYGSGNITVIDGATNSTTRIRDPNASLPYDAAVNPATNKVYVGNFASNMSQCSTGPLTPLTP